MTDKVGGQVPFRVPARLTGACFARYADGRSARRQVAQDVTRMWFFAPQFGQARIIFAKAAAV